MKHDLLFTFLVNLGKCEQFHILLPLAGLHTTTHQTNNTFLPFQTFAYCMIQESPAVADKPARRGVMYL